MNRWIVVYDIADDRRRRRVEKCLGARMERIQESVFEGWLAPHEVEGIVATLRSLIEADRDGVRCYPVGGADGAVAPLPPFWIL